ncbi:protein of unknown function [Methanoculleus bourgensis]|uniref:Uncharacterized protein n=1 Tax=Methanoculleus bourgensis TaxID=83986 RepID=A0A0X3BNY1_9EURY|nr:protein of unknown function [Methanoculleus bourgensis]
MAERFELCHQTYDQIGKYIQQYHFGITEDIHVPTAGRLHVSDAPPLWRMQIRFRDADHAALDGPCHQL